MTGEEKEERLKDLMNRISIELKNETLQQGFEIICKRLSELEKENKLQEEIIIGEQQEINRLEKEKCKLLGIIQCKDEVIDELKQSCW